MFLEFSETYFINFANLPVKNVCYDDVERIQALLSLITFSSDLIKGLFWNMYYYRSMMLPYCMLFGLNDLLSEGRFEMKYLY